MNGMLGTLREIRRQETRSSQSYETLNPNHCNWLWDKGLVEFDETNNYVTTKEGLRMLEQHEAELKMKTDEIFNEIKRERVRQDDLFGEQNHQNGTDRSTYISTLNDERSQYKINKRKGTPTWSNILLEEVYEALSENDSLHLRDELVQVAAVAVAWIQCLDRKRAAE